MTIKKTEKKEREYKNITGIKTTKASRKTEGQLKKKQPKG